MFVEVEDALLNVVAFGSGERTLVAHGGWAGSWELWQQPFELLSNSRLCVSYDHRGSGATVSNASSISAERLVDDLFAVLDALSIERCTLAAESMGGLIALMAVQREPDRFDELVLVSAVPAITIESARWLIEGSRHDYPAVVDAFTAACVPEQGADHLIRWGRQILLRSEPEAAARLLEGCLDRQVDLTQIRTPSLVIHGDADAIVPVDVARFVASQLPNATLRILEGAGHVPTMTRPHDVVSAILDL